MRKIFAALTLALILISGNLSEAANITSEQADKVLNDFKNTEYASTLNIDTETFITRFNWFIVPIVQDGLDKDDISDIEHLFVLENCKTLATDKGNVYYKIFGYGGAMVVMVSSGDDEHDPLKSTNFCYVTPETKGDAVLMTWLLRAFVGSISTDIDVKNLMGELTAEGSAGSVIKAGVKFSVKESDGLNILSVTAKQ